MKDACDAGEVRVVCIRTQTCSLSKPLDIQKFHKHAKTVLNVVLWGILRALQIVLRERSVLVKLK